MADIVVPSAGALELAGYCLRNPIPDTEQLFLLDLYQNNYSPTLATVFSDFVIADFIGYGQVQISPGQMNAPSLINNMANVSCTLNPITWANNGTEQLLYGFVVSSAATGNVLWCEQWDFPVMLGFKKNLALNLSLNVFGSNL